MSVAALPAPVATPAIERHPVIESAVAKREDAASVAVWPPAPGPAYDDPFHDPAMSFLAIVFIVAFLLSLGVGGVMYWGVQYRVPSWNVHSVPPPLFP